MACQLASHTQRSVRASLLGSEFPLPRSNNAAYPNLVRHRSSIQNIEKETIISTKLVPGRKPSQVRSFVPICLPMLVLIFRHGFCMHCLSLDSAGEDLAALPDDPAAPGMLQARGARDVLKIQGVGKALKTWRTKLSPTKYRRENRHENRHENQHENRHEVQFM